MLLHLPRLPKLLSGCARTGKTAVAASPTATADTPKNFAVFNRKLITYAPKNKNYKSGKDYNNVVEFADYDLVRRNLV
jgi:hypothetical protein